MGNKGDSPDAEIARLAARQHGVVTHRQLLAAGLGRSAISKRNRRGRLHRMHQGVYAVGYRRRSLETRWMAAVLACGEGAVLCHRSAAALWGLLRPSDGPIDVSVPGDAGRRQRAGIRLHRRIGLRAGMTTRHRGIPVTNPAQTIADLSGTVTAAEERRAIREGQARGLRIGIGPGHSGTRSELEHAFLALCRRQRLPLPETNVRIGRRVVDFLWPRQRVIVETDGYQFHRGSVAFEDDRERDIELRSLGYDVVRLSYRQVTKSPDRAARAVREALADPRWRICPPEEHKGAIR